MPTLDSDIQELFQGAEEKNTVVELTQDQIWRLLSYECEMGGVTVEDLLEVRKTRIWPKGKCNVWAADAELLLEMLPEEYIAARQEAP